MPGKILLSAFFAMLVFPVPAADADHNRNAVKAAGQFFSETAQHGEVCLFCIIYTTR